MPPGTVKDPTTDESTLKTGYILRYDKFEEDTNGQLKPVVLRMPVLNAQTLREGDLVVFDVFQKEITHDDITYTIPVAVIPEGFENSTWDLNLLDRWDSDWKKARALHGENKLPKQKKDDKTWEEIKDGKTLKE